MSNDEHETDDQRKHEAERGDDDAPATVIFVADITYMNKLSSNRAFRDAPVPILDSQCLKKLVETLYFLNKQKLKMHTASMHSSLFWSLVYHGMSCRNEKKTMTQLYTGLLPEKKYNWHFVNRR